MNDTTKEIRWDTGATAPVAFSKDDFDDGIIIPSPDTRVMKGLATGLAIHGMGTITYSVLDVNGNVHNLTSIAYYVPTVGRRIFSPQAYFQNKSTDHSILSTQNWRSIQLHFHKKDDDSSKCTTLIDIPYNKANNLPTFHATQVGMYQNKRGSPTECNDFGVATPTNLNLTPAQKELLVWHYRFGHYNLRGVQQVLRSACVGVSSLIRAAAKCTLPKCASCLYSNARRRTTTTAEPHTGPSSRANPTPTDESAGRSQNPAIARNNLFPGSMVSMDHFSVRTPGRMFETRGNTSNDKFYHGGCLFVDHASGFVHVDLHIHQNSTETIQAKQNFEKKMYEHGVVVTNYHSDNGIFSSRAFVDEINKSNQQIKCSGVGGHHQNGIAEWAIGTILSMARTMMIHAAIQWREVITLVLWPMAVTYAIYIHNHMPKTNDTSPMELLTSAKYPRNRLVNCHVFGSPAYVLDPRLHNAGGFVPKFTPRSRRGVFVGISPRHSSTVPLVLNLTTLEITPQFHVVFDDLYSTVSSTTSEKPAEVRCTSVGNSTH